MISRNEGVIGFNLSFLFDQRELLKADLGRVLDLFEAGALTAPDLSVFAVERAGDAHRALESGQTVGKLVLQFS